MSSAGALLLAGWAVQGRGTTCHGGQRPGQQERCAGVAAVLKGQQAHLQEGALAGAFPPHHLYEAQELGKGEEQVPDVLGAVLCR